MTNDPTAPENIELDIEIKRAMVDACVAVLIDAGLDAKWASGSVGLALMFLAVLLVIAGVILLKRINRVATLPLRNLQRDAQAMKAALHDK
jgi:hypothetical protein